MTTRTLRRLTVSTAVAMAFGPLANAQGLFDSTAAQAGLVGGLSTQLEKLAPNSHASLHVGGFATALQEALKEPSDKTRTIVYPQTNSNSLLVTAAVVPPKGFGALPIPVCAQQHGKVLGTWNITAKGDVVPVPAAYNPEGSTRAACNAFVQAARADINARLAQAQPPGGTPPQPPPELVHLPSSHAQACSPGVPAQTLLQAPSSPAGLFAVRCSCCWWRS